MLKPTELRIGDIVSYRAGTGSEQTYHRVISIEPTTVKIENSPFADFHLPEKSTSYLGYDDIEGIVLTPQVLDFCMFDKPGMVYRWTNKISVHFDPVAMSCEIIAAGFVAITGITMLHQLQNLLFDMVGQELEIKALP